MKTIKLPLTPKSNLIIEAAVEGDGVFISNDVQPDEFIELSRKELDAFIEQLPRLKQLLMLA